MSNSQIGTALAKVGAGAGAGTESKGDSKAESKAESKTDFTSQKYLDQLILLNRGLSEANRGRDGIKIYLSVNISPDDEVLPALRKKALAEHKTIEAACIANVTAFQTNFKTLINDFEADSLPRSLMDNWISHRNFESLVINIMADDLIKNEEFFPKLMQHSRNPYSPLGFYSLESAFPKEKVEAFLDSVLSSDKKFQCLIKNLYEVVEAGSTTDKLQEYNDSFVKKFAALPIDELIRRSRSLEMALSMRFKDYYPLFFGENGTLKEYREAFDNKTCKLYGVTFEQYVEFLRRTSPQNDSSTSATASVAPAKKM